MNKFQTPVFKTQNKGAYQLSDYMQAEKRYWTRLAGIAGTLLLIMVGFFVGGMIDASQYDDAQAIQQAVQTGGLQIGGR